VERGYRRSEVYRKIKWVVHIENGFAGYVQIRFYLK